MSEINWFELPYNHSGRWEKKIDSIMNPGSKVTWPQFVAEMIVYWRTQFIKDYKDIKRGNGWSQSIQKHVRDLNQQASVICNYFPHPDDESLVAVAFKNFIRKAKPLKIGKYRKTRFTTQGGRKVSNITQDEKDVVTGIMAEFNRLKEQRNVFIDAAPKFKEPAKSPDQITFKTTSTSSPKNKLAAILALEQQMAQKKEQ